MKKKEKPNMDKPQKYALEIIKAVKEKYPERTSFSRRNFQAYVFNKREPNKIPRNELEIGLQYLQEIGLLLENPKDVNKELVFNYKIFQEGFSLEKRSPEKYPATKADTNTATREKEQSEKHVTETIDVKWLITAIISFLILMVGIYNSCK